MLVFRLFRVGKNNQPSFKIVVTDKRNPAKGGRFVEQIGFYNPVTKEKVLNKERAQYWLKQGVQPSATLHNIFIKDGILEGKKIPKHKKSKKLAVPASAETKSSEAKPSSVEPQKEVKPAEKPADKPAEVKPVEVKLQSKEKPKLEETPKSSSVPEGATAGKDEKPIEEEPKKEEFKPEEASKTAK